MKVERFQFDSKYSDPTSRFGMATLVELSGTALASGKATHYVSGICQCVKNRCGIVIRRFPRIFIGAFSWHAGSIISTLIRVTVATISFPLNPRNEKARATGQRQGGGLSGRRLMIPSGRSNIDRGARGGVDLSDSFLFDPAA